MTSAGNSGLRNTVSLTLETHSATAVLYKKKRVVCLQLPDGTWFAVRTNKKQTPALLMRLGEIYKERLIAI
jgi:hypothetical protein